MNKAEKFYPLHTEKAEENPIETLDEVHVASPYDSRVNDLDSQSFDDQAQDFQALSPEEIEQQKQ